MKQPIHVASNSELSINNVKSINTITTQSQGAQTMTINTSQLMKQYKYGKDHYYYLSAKTLLHPFYMAHKLALYFLLTHTNAGCHFIHDVATMYLIITCGEILVIPLTGYIADNLKVYNHIILLAVFLIHFCLSIITYLLFLFFMNSSNTFKWIIISIFIFQNYVSMQLNNSFYKLMKIFMDYDSKHKKEENINKNNLQTMYFTSIGIWSKFGSNLLSLFPLIPMFLMMEYVDNINFYFVQSFMIGFHILCGIIMVFVVISIYLIYKERPEIYGPNDDKMVMKRCGYLERSFKSLFCMNTITRNGVIHLILVYILTDFMQSYEPLAVAGIRTDKNDETLTTFCGGFLTNLIYQSIFGSSFTAIGALVYMYVIVPFVDSKLFYLSIYPIASVFVAVALFAISGIVGNVNETILAISFGFILAFFTYAHQYDDFINLGYMNTQNVGFYQILYSYSQTIWKIFGYLFLFLGSERIMVAIVIVILLIASVIQSLLFSRHFIKVSDE